MSILILLEKRLIPFILPLEESISGMIIDLASINEQEYCLAEKFLHHEERYKCHRFIDRALAKKFSLCRVLARFLIGKAVGVDFSTIKFDYEEFGRPFVPDLTLDFNISHSQNLGIICWSYGKKVGVDIEYIDPNFAYQSVLDIFAFENEIRWILEKDSLLRFYQLWTIKESILKYSGKGLRSSFPKLKQVNQISFYQDKKISSYRYNEGYYLSICQKI